MEIVLRIFWNLAAFTVALSMLIIVHEFGHFWVARRYGVHVERFSIGFGKPLWRYVDHHGTEFVISLIPFGGYVKMLSESFEFVSPETHHYVFSKKTVGQRASIIAAGSIANFFFAVFVYWISFIIGIPSVRPIVGEIVANSVAASAQITPGMEFKAIDGIETPDWDTVRLQLMSKVGDTQDTISVLLFGFGQQEEKILNLQNWSFKPDEDPIMALGIRPRSTQIETILAEVKDFSTAKKAGLQAGDKIVKVNGQTLTQWVTFVNLVRDNPGKPLLVEIERYGNPLSLTLIPDMKLEEGKIEGFVGVVPKVGLLSDEYKIIRKYGPIDAIVKAVEKTWKLMKLTINMSRKLIIGKIKLDNISGPVSIAQGAGTSAKLGEVYYLMFLAVISINLGIINLFPLPVLDGGHLLFLIIEKLKGSPVSEKVQNFSYRIGSIFIILLMGLSIFNDFFRVIN